MSSQALSKGPRFSEKDWYYLQAQTDVPFHYLKLVVWIFARFLILLCSSSFFLSMRNFQTFRFKIVIWHIFLSPIKFSENKQTLAWHCLWVHMCSVAQSTEMVFCYQNCSDLLWEKVFLWSIKTFEIWGWRSRICKNIEITRAIYSNNVRSEQFLIIECFFNFFLEVFQIK